MNVIPLNFAVFGACISLDTAKPFDFKIAYTVTPRRLRPKVKSDLIDPPKTGKPTEMTSVATHSSP